MKCLIRSILLVTLCTFLVSSCTVEEKVVGNFNPEKKSVKYSKSHDMYFFWNMVQGRDAEDYVEIKNYQKITKRTAFDAIWYVGSLGFISPYTVVFRFQKDSDEANSIVRRQKEPLVPEEKLEQVVEK